MKTTLGGVSRILSSNLWDTLSTSTLVADLPISTPCWLFKNGNYHILFLEDGSKIRFNDEDTLIPDHPEGIDMTISIYCEHGCPFCYMSCDTNGKKINVNHPDLETILKQLWPGTELAVNCNTLNGDITSSFDSFLRKVNEVTNGNIFVNATVNAEDFIVNPMQFQMWQREGLLRGIGVSINEWQNYNKYQWEKAFGIVDNVVLHVIPEICTREYVMNIVNYMPYRVKNILLLGYKHLGRANDEVLDTEMIHQREKNISDWKHTCIACSDGKSDGIYISPSVRLCLDGLALEQFSVREWFDPIRFKQVYAGNEGAYTMFIDIPNRKYARSSIEKERYDWGDMTLMEMFESIRTAPLGTKGGGI